MGFAVFIQPEAFRVSCPWLIDNLRCGQGFKLPPCSMHPLLALHVYVVIQEDFKLFLHIWSKGKSIFQWSSHCYTGDSTNTDNR